MTFLVINGTPHWLCISNLFLKDVKVNRRQSPDYKFPTSKANKEIDVIKKLNNVLPMNGLLAIYKSFVRHHLNYGNTIYHQHSNESMKSKLESVKYNTTLAITGTIKKLYGQNFKDSSL